MYFTEENAKKIDAKKAITTEVIIASGIAKSVKAGIRLLAKGEIKSKVNIEVDGASAAAIAEAGEIEPNQSL